MTKIKSLADLRKMKEEVQSKIRLVDSSHSGNDRSTGPAVPHGVATESTYEPGGS